MKMTATNRCDRPRSMTRLARVLVLAPCLLLMTSASAFAQRPRAFQPRAYQVENLSGPRFGVTLLSEGTIEALAERDIVVRPLISQFGWQFERRIYTSPRGVTALTEWVPLISGLEQGKALPSLNWLVGVRTPDGAEFGLGPNLSPAGIGLVIAAGVTLSSGPINVPINFAVTTSESGMRVSILTGFNLRR